MPTDSDDRRDLITSLQDRIANQVGADALIVPSEFALLDFPNHSNVGDNAIWLGELAYFRSVHRTYPTYVCTKNNASWRALEKLDGPIFLHGGGNFGDLWPAHHRFREAVLERFRGHPVIQLPQSIHFDDPRAFKRTASIIERHGNFTLLVRDRASLAISESFSCSASLCPDMAFFLGPMERSAPPTRALLCLLRTDKEKAAPYCSRNDVPIADWMTGGFAAKVGEKAIDLAGGFTGGNFGGLYERMARNRLIRGLALLSSAKAVVTDRLHGHILCLLLGIPHVALDNSYGKIGSFIDNWTQTSNLVARAPTLEDAIRTARLMADADVKSPSKDAGPY